MTTHKEDSIMLPEAIIKDKIFLIRGQKVMLDRDLAELYGVETKYLKRQVKRNSLRFPNDFMFELTHDEFIEWRSQYVTSKEDKQGLRYAPYAFTENGVAQLSSVLNSERAIKVNLQIIRLFTTMRQLASNHKEILNKLDELERKGIERDEKFMLIFEYIKQFEGSKQEELEYQNRKPIGYKTKK